MRVCTFFHPLLFGLGTTFCFLPLTTGIRLTHPGRKSLSWRAGGGRKRGGGRFRREMKYLAWAFLPSSLGALLPGARPPSGAETLRIARCEGGGTTAREAGREGGTAREGRNCGKSQPIGGGFAARPLPPAVGEPRGCNGFPLSGGPARARPLRLVPPGGGGGPSHAPARHLRRSCP